MRITRRQLRELIREALDVSGHKPLIKQLLRAPLEQAWELAQSLEDDHPGITDALKMTLWREWREYTRRVNVAELMSNEKYSAASAWRKKVGDFPAAPHLTDEEEKRHLDLDMFLNHAIGDQSAWEWGPTDQRKEQDAHWARHKFGIDAIRKRTGWKGEGGLYGERHWTDSDWPYEGFDLPEED